MKNTREEIMELIIEYGGQMYYLCECENQEDDEDVLATRNYSDYLFRKIEEKIMK